MAAKFIPISEPANEAERQAIRFLVEGLPQDYTVYGNPWLVERNGGIFELDTVVVAPHAVFIVEIKSYRGKIEGTDHDWYTPDPIRSPLKLNRLTAQVLKTQLKRKNFEAGQIWIEGFIFLSATMDVGVRGPASTDRIHTKKSILAALQNPEIVERFSGRQPRPLTPAVDRDILELFTGVKDGRRPARSVREYDIIERLNLQNSFTELLGRNRLSGAFRVLRIYSVKALASDADFDRVAQRARWEVQVLGRLGRIDGILAADPPFSEEADIVLPLEHFDGITLTTWVTRYGPGLFLDSGVVAVRS